MNTPASHRSAPPHGAGSDPEGVVAAVEGLGTVHKTPCGTGEMVWRRWGNGSPVMLLHGGAGSWSHWLRNIEPLCQRHTLCAPDMPGFGDSALPAQPSIDSFLETIERG